MGIEDIITRTLPARPWDEGDNIPWHDPDFSRRMLAVHLDQGSDMASRKFATIDRQVRWIHEHVLGSLPTQVLDLACGPGLYTNRLARLGHRCVGVDSGPAAIQHAREEAAAADLACEYRLADVRGGSFGTGFDLAMMLFGQINVFRREQARAILEQANSALLPGGRILLEPQRFETVEQCGHAPSTWSTHGPDGSVFSDRPHLLLTENFWDPDERANTQRFFIIAPSSREVTRHAMTTIGYTESEMETLLVQSGFEEIRFHPSLVGEAVDDRQQAVNFAVTARKRAT